MIFADPGPDETPPNLRRPPDLEVGRHSSLQDGRPARPAARGLHHAPAEAGRQVPAQVSHFHSRKHGRRGAGQLRRQVLPLASRQAVNHDLPACGYG